MNGERSVSQYLSSAEIRFETGAGLPTLVTLATPTRALVAQLVAQLLVYSACQRDIAREKKREREKGREQESK